jgi:hypothetical protein
MKNAAQGILEYLILLAIAIIALISVNYIAPGVRDKFKSGIFKDTKDYIAKPFDTQ